VRLKTEEKETQVGKYGRKASSWRKIDELGCGVLDLRQMFTTEKKKEEDHGEINVS